jgi:hypothetical protein
MTHPNNDIALCNVQYASFGRVKSQAMSSGVSAPQATFRDPLEPAAIAGLSCGGRGNSKMTALHPIRKACPSCGKPMAAVPDDVAEGRPRYVCASCDDDPLHDPTARRWADGPLRAPGKA